MKTAKETSLAFALGLIPSVAHMTLCIILWRYLTYIVGTDNQSSKCNSSRVSKVVTFQSWRSEKNPTHWVRGLTRLGPG